MNIIINEKVIDEIPFDDYFTNIVNIVKDDENHNEFYEKKGKQHYRLLSYFSTLFNDCHIIDIGTHTGMSSLALSYNERNTVYSFDISDNVTNPFIRGRINIKNIFDNLWDKVNQKIWKKKILESKFIFLDVDPHDGELEMEFITFLKEIGYPGFVICDDIWYFENMRNHFWYKLNKNYCYDVTEFGHWSGTGIITFNNNFYFQLNKTSPTNWTLVTAYFNLGKCEDASEEIKNRDTPYYLRHSVSTLSLPFNLVIYCDKETEHYLKKIRPEYLKSKTYYVICDFEDFTFTKKGEKLNITFSDYRKKIIQNRKKHPYQFDNRNTASYYLFCMSRYIMLKETIQTNLFNSTHFAWINLCMERMGYLNIMHLEEALQVNRDKFSTCYIDYIPKTLVDNTKEYFEYGRCGMCSGFFTGNAKYMYQVCELIENKFLEYLEMGYGHADEQLFTPVYYENEDLFEHYYGDYQQMITNYKYVYENPETIQRNFITNSLNDNYHKCVEASNYILSSIDLEKCNTNNETIEWLKSLITNFKI